MLAWIALLGAIFFVTMGLGYWIRSGQSVTTCVFGHPDCSTAAATWTLLIATVCAFIAAYEAAMKAGQALSISQKALKVSADALEVEQEPILGQWLCTDEDSHKVPREIIFVEDHDYSVGKPKKYPQDVFLPVHFDFENLGRNALLDVKVTLRLQWGTKEQPILVSLGSIGAHRDAHVSVYLLWDSATRPQISWLPEASILARSDQDPTSLAPKKLSFSPFPTLAVEGPIERIASSGHGEQSHGTSHEKGKTRPPQAPPPGSRWWINQIDTDAKKREVGESKPASASGKKSGSVREDPEATE